MHNQSNEMSSWTYSHVILIFSLCIQSADVNTPPRAPPSNYTTAKLRPHIPVCYASALWLLILYLNITIIIDISLGKPSSFLPRNVYKHREHFRTTYHRGLSDSKIVFKSHRHLVISRPDKLLRH